MDKLIKCTIHSIRVSLTSDDRIVVLKEEGRERFLPVWIGKFETSNLTLILEKTAVARPLTHDLAASLIEKLGGALLRVEIVALVESTYMANLVIRKENQVLVIDSRPSDAMTLAVRIGAPIFVAESILDSVGIEPELERTQAGSDEAEPDLSLFNDFFETLEKPDSDQEESKE